MRIRALSSLFVLGLLAGCNDHAVVNTPDSHPASPNAVEAPVTSPSSTLGSGTTPPSAGATPAPQPDGNNSTPANAKATYTCPMHPEVLSDKPGNCPLCGMNLVLKK